MQKISYVTVVILVGGLGTRLRSVVPDHPKALAEVRGRPFLAYLLDQCVAVGCRSVVLCTGYMGEKVQTAFGDSYNGLRLVYSQESSQLGTAGALRLASNLFKSDPFVVMNGDSFCQADIGAFWNWHWEKGANATLLLSQVPNVHQYGQVELNEEGLVLSFSEKDSRTGTGWINAGIYIISRSLIEKIPEGLEVSLERNIFPSWIGHGLYGYKNNGRFIDIGTPESYHSAERFFSYS